MKPAEWQSGRLCQGDETGSPKAFLRESEGGMVAPARSSPTAWSNAGCGGLCGTGFEVKQGADWLHLQAVFMSYYFWQLLRLQCAAAGWLVGRKPGCSTRRKAAGQLSACSAAPRP